MSITRRSLLQSMAAAPLAAQGKRPPNVLFVAVDDLNVHLNCYGFKAVKSPNIDALAGRAMRFDRAYCQYPLCNPSRSSLLSGRRPPRTKVDNNTTWFRDTIPDVVTLPQHFREHGYFTAKTGKIFHDGLDDPKAWDVGGTPHVVQQARTGQAKLDREKRADRWEKVEGEGENEPDYKTATEAVELLERKHDKPFFIAVGFRKPHVPFIAPKKYFDLYDPNRMELPPDFAPRVAGTGPAYRPNFDLFIRRDAPPPLARQGIAAYFAAISFMDAQLGRVMAALDRLGLRDNTIVSLFGDHGWHLGEKGMWSKMTLFEVGVHAPLLISTPGMKTAGKNCATPVEFVDIYPTLADMAGLPVPSGLDGRSLRPLLTDPQSKWDKLAYTYQVRGEIRGVTVRNRRFRYTEWDQGRAGTELYDEDADSAEMHNMAADPKYAATVKDMKAQLVGHGW
jgi:iduronate 2-sulfatase